MPYLKDSVQDKKDSDKSLTSFLCLTCLDPLNRILKMRETPKAPTSKMYQRINKHVLKMLLHVAQAFVLLLDVSLGPITQTSIT